MLDPMTEENQTVSDPEQTLPDEESTVSDEVMDRTTKQMQELFGDEGPVDFVPDETLEEQDDDSQKISDDEDDESDGKDVESEGEDADDDGVADTDESESVDEGEAVEDESSSTLPVAYRRSLKARNWTDDEIDGFYAQDTDLAMKTFERIHSSRTEEISRFAALGREAQKQAEPDAQTASQRQQAPVDSDGMALIDEEALIAEHGNEAVVHAIAAPVNAVIGRLNQILPEMMSSVTAIRQSREEALGEQIEAFFTSEDMVPYVSVYGTAEKGLTDEQLENRTKVVQSADAMSVGASMQGRKITNEEALMGAHDMVASRYKEVAIRKSIKKVVKDRNKGITLKPSARAAKDASSTKPRTEADMETRVKVGLRAVFG